MSLGSTWNIAKQIKNQICLNWNEVTNIQRQRVSENATLTAYLNGERVFIRVTPAWHRSIAQLVSEAAFINELATLNVPVAKPIPTLNGQMICTALV